MITNKPDGFEGLGSLAGWELIRPVDPEDIPDQHELARRAKERRGAAERYKDNLHGKASERVRDEVDKKLHRLGAFVAGATNRFTAYYPLGEFAPGSPQALAGELFEARLRFEGPVWPAVVDLSKPEAVERGVLYADTGRGVRLIRELRTYGQGSAEVFYHDERTIDMPTTPADQA